MTSLALSLLRESGTSFLALRGFSRAFQRIVRTPSQGTQAAGPWRFRMSFCAKASSSLAYSGRNDCSHTFALHHIFVKSSCQRKATCPRMPALLLLLLLCLVLFLQIPTSAAAGSGDVEFLLGFMRGIDKDPLGSLKQSWVPNNHNSDGCPSNWHGVSCDKGKVTALDLGGLALSGQISPGTLGQLSALAFLSLRNNFLAGSLPHDLGELSLLRQLDLSNNLFAGSIPETFGGLMSLQNLSLASNNLSGSIPDMFKGMPSLLELDISKNSLSGIIPVSIVSLEKLAFLDLSSNQLNGSIPSQLNLLEALEVLHLHDNRLSSSIAPSWMSLEKIQRVDLSMNELSGMLPWLESLLPPNLLYVNLSFNHISGLLAPENAANLFANKIQVLDVSNNQLSGSLPSFEFVFSLRTLKLKRNQFTGFVPPALLSAEASLLEELDLSENRLSGNVWAISAARLNLLNLSSNMLSGGLPPKLGTCASVDLSNNIFSGNLSVMRTWGNSLESIDLSNNSLSGLLPNEAAQLLRLISLNLSRNRLIGSIPHSFGSFPKLTSLDLSGNSLTGLIPSSFFFSVSLATLKLSHNQLAGGIPLDGTAASSSLPTQLDTSLQPDSLPFSPLRVLDLSVNQLNGSITTKLSAFSTLEQINLSGNRFSGTIPPEITQLAHLQRLDLSSNHLSGSIPSKLPASLNDLNLSNNNLSGSIPSQLEQKFPPSSFYPGNPELQSTGFPSWSGSPQANEPKGLINKAHGGKVSPAFKAGLIGGCTAAAILIVLISLFVYYRRVARSRDRSSIPVFRIVEKDFVHHPTVSSPQRFADTDKEAFAREPVLSTKGKLPSFEGQNPEAEMSPSRILAKGFFSSLKPEPLSVEQSVSSKVNSPDKLAGDLFLLDTGVVFTAEELSRAPAEVLGRSSHGTSYKATLDSGHTITVKWLKEGLAKSKREFTTEAKKFGSIRHPNVLPLRGYYWGPREHEKLILTDYVAYGSLADRLTERSGRRYPPLTWLQRLRVSADIARGLCYLHNDHRMSHGNLKASNVLFDGPELDGRLTDYSLHRLMTAAGTASQILNAGALGYRAPELSNVKRPKPTTRADVYAYGVILLEILTGKGAGDIITGNSGAIDLPDWVRFLVSESRTVECFDQVLIGVNRDQAIPKGMHQVLDAALKCISESSNRPAITSVYEEIAAVNSSTQASQTQ